MILGVWSLYYKNKPKSCDMWIYICISKSEKEWRSWMNQCGYMAGRGDPRMLKGETQTHICIQWFIIMSWRYFHHAKNFKSGRNEREPYKSHPYSKIPEFPPKGTSVLGTVQVWGAESTKVSTYLHMPHSLKQGLNLLVCIRTRQWKGMGVDWPHLGMGLEPYLGRIMLRAMLIENALAVVCQYAVTISCVLILWLLPTALWDGYFVIIPILQMSKPSLRELICPRSHSWSQQR